MSIKIRRTKQLISQVSMPSADRIKALKIKRRAKRKLIRTSLIAGNICLLLVVSIFILSNRSASSTVRRSTVSSVAQIAANVQSPLDQLSSAEIAAQVAQLSNISTQEKIAVRNQADSENAQLSIVPSDTNIVAKPQLVSTTQKSKKNIIHYSVLEGETISSIATKFAVSPDNIRWSNNLTGDKIDAGKKIVIPPAAGVVYQVKTNDTIDSITSKYQADRNLFIIVNDAESGSLIVGDLVFIPNGVKPAPVTRYSTTRYTGFAWGGFNPIYSYNGYDYGYCTWYVANKRAAAGNPVPSNLGNASTWKVLAQRAGLPTGPTPKPGAVAWKVPYDYYGHVAYVEEVYADGSFKVSEMNTAGWARVSVQMVPASVTGNYYFIY